MTVPLAVVGVEDVVPASVEAAGLEGENAQFLLTQGA